MNAQIATVNMIAPVLARLAKLAPRPASLEATGLAPELLAQLVLKHLWRAGSLSHISLAERLGLAGSVLEPILQFLRQQGRLQLQGHGGNAGEIRLALTDVGREAAKDALTHCGYIGPAPVPLQTYMQVVRAQQIPRTSLTRAGMRAAFEHIVIDETLCDRLGVAMASGRAIFLYGPAGAGKTYLASRLIEALTGEVLIPYAVEVGNQTIVRVFDSAVHERVELLEGNRHVLHAHGFDARFALCDRPLIAVGGELTLEMLDIAATAAGRELMAPIQMKANNGVLLVDDLGRQRFLPQRLFDRWIVPLEQRLDHLSARETHFSVPFDPIVVFSTNLEPAELADDGVLRRLGYKIELGPLPVELYRRVWANVCAELQVPCDPALLEYVLTRLYPPSGQRLLACHPRDLLSMALDKTTYEERGGSFAAEDLRWAWQHYFLPQTDDHTPHRTRHPAPR